MGQNSFLTTDWLSMEALDLLTNSLELTSHLYTGFSKEYQKPFAVGETIRVQYPPKWLIRNGIEYDPQGIAEINTTITCNQVFGVDFEWNDIEQVLQLERDDTRQTNFYIKGPIAQIAQEWDTRSGRFAGQYTSLISGTLGTDPTSFATFSNLAEQKLFEMACPQDGDKAMVITPAQNTALLATVTNVFNPADEISREFKKGIIGMQAGMTYYRSMSIYRHTAGTWSSSVTVSGASQSGASLLVNCTSGDTFKKGDKIGIASVYNANPMTRQRTNSAYTFTFTVTADVTATASTATLPISPSIYGPGSPYQNVDALPADTAALTLFPGTTSPNGKSGAIGVAIHPWAFAIVGVPLDLPKNQQIARQQRDQETGMAIRMVRAWDPVESRYVNRFDTLGGYGVLYNGNCAVGMLGA
ncbi:MAG: Rhodoferax phage [Verrucomicrobiota bacterium]|jgi:hypothetical protein